MPRPQLKRPALQACTHYRRFLRALFIDFAPQTLFVAIRRVGRDTVQGHSAAMAPTRGRCLLAVALLATVTAAHASSPLWRPDQYPNPMSPKGVQACGRGVPSAICDADHVLTTQGANILEGEIGKIRSGQEPYVTAPCGSEGNQGFQVGGGLWPTRAAHARRCALVSPSPRRAGCSQRSIVCTRRYKGCYIVCMAALGCSLMPTSHPCIHVQAAQPPRTWRVWHAWHAAHADPQALHLVSSHPPSLSHTHTHTHANMQLQIGVAVMRRFEGGDSSDAAQIAAEFARALQGASSAARLSPGSCTNNFQPSACGNQPHAA